MTPELFTQYKLGIPEIDDEHWIIFGLIEKILTQVVANPSNVHSLLTELISEVTSHSDAEIDLMRSMNFPFIDTHIVEHTLLAHNIEKALEGAKVFDYRTITAAAEQLFIDHIVQYDSLYAEYAKNMNYIRKTEVQ